MAYGIGSTLGLVEKSVTDDLKIVGLPARVVDIILDDTHDEWSDQGEIEALGAIKYRIIGVEQDESDPLELDIAYPLNSTFKVYPLLNEIVLLYSLPDILREIGRAHV
jgi:hypothetical protein